MRKLNQRGYNLVELSIAVLILGAMASSVMMARTFLAKQTQNNNDKAYATQKAIQMLSELQAVAGAKGSGVDTLDNYSDGSSYDKVLTTDKTVDTHLSTANPGDPLSGNRKTDGNWRYLRQVQINRQANDPYARQVIINVWKYDSDQDPNEPAMVTGANGAIPVPALATVGCIIRNNTTVFPPTQVLDLYVLDVNNVSAWWAVTPQLTTAFNEVYTDLETRNPGLQLRVHKIIRTAFGRDLLYWPYINDAGTSSYFGTNTTDGTPMPWVYFYPGSAPELASPDGSGDEEYFYDPTVNGVRLCGNFTVNNIQNYVASTLGYPITNTYTGLNSNGNGFPVADQYNHGMRYPDEVAMYNAVSQSWSNYCSTLGTGSIPPQKPEISERMLIEGMLSTPQSFTNAMIFNMHGELMPLPPMHNYSDAAKDPANLLSGYTTLGPVTQAGATQAVFPGTTSTYASGVSAYTDEYVRVVTHPELLYYPTTASNSTTAIVRLRVYAYLDGFDYPVSLTTQFPATADPKVPAISLFFPDASVSVLGVTAIIGNGVTATTGNVKPVTYQYDALPLATGSIGTNSTYTDSGGKDQSFEPVSMAVSYVGPNNLQTLMTLYNTRLRCPNGFTTAGGGVTTCGLNSSDVLYGDEYIPCSPDIATTFIQGYSSGMTVNFTNQDLTNATAGPSYPKNTARWVLTLSMPITSAFSSLSATNPLVLTDQPVTQTFTSPTTFTGMHIIETRLGAGVTTEYYNTAAGVTWVPSNLSRTYVWTGSASATFAPPYTERVQFMGDPRHEPYLDVKVGGVTQNSPPVTIGALGYNWWFKNMGQAGTTTPSWNSDGYYGFAGNAGNQLGWNGTLVDLPRYYEALRNGIISSTSIYATTNGWNDYYYGVGGEFGFDQWPFSQTNNSGGNSGISFIEGPWQTTYSATVNSVDEIQTDAGNIINEKVACSTASAATNQPWYARYWMGEIYPDSMAVSWMTYGNIPTNYDPITVATVAHSYYRADLESIATAGAKKTLSGFSTSNEFNKMPSTTGITAWYDGSDSGATSGNYMEDQSNSSSATLQQPLGLNDYNIFEFPLVSPISAQRSWDLGRNQGTPPEWGRVPYVNEMPTLSIAEVGTTQRILYNSNESGETTTGVLQMTQNSNVGYSVATGSSPSALSGLNTLAETALVETLATFLDGGQIEASGTAGHIPQLPLIEVWTNPVPQFAAPSSIPLTVASAVTNSSALPVSNIWYRYAGLSGQVGCFYTPEYPGYDSGATNVLSDSTYTEPVDLILNLKYSQEGSLNWYNMVDNSGSVTGQLDTGTSGSGNHAVTLTSSQFPYAYTLSTPVASFPEGDYYLMAEVWRLNTATTQVYPLHYSYHYVPINITR